MKRSVCSLPKLFCEAGCIYREQSFRHLACPTALKDKKDCVLPGHESKQSNYVCGSKSGGASR